MSLEMSAVEEFLERAFQENYELLRMEGGILHPLALEEARQQVLLYWRKLKQIAESVTETEVKLTLPNQQSPKGRTYAIEGVVDIVREAGRTTMYDIKTQTNLDISAKVEEFEQQLNVYAHIWQHLQGNELESTAIIATKPPKSLSRALAAGDTPVINIELEKWEPVVPVPFRPERVQATIRAFGEVVDLIEESEFAPPGVDVLGSRYGNSRQLFGTLVCADCDARYSCRSYREYAGMSRGRLASQFAQIYAPTAEPLEVEQWRSAALDAEIEIVERPQWEETLAVVKAEIIADTQLDEEQKIEKIAETLLPAAERFFESVPTVEVDAALNVELPRWRTLPRAAQKFLQTGEYQVKTQPEDLDFSTAVIPFSKAVEVTLDERIFAPFKQSGATGTIGDQFLSEYVRRGKPLTLRNVSIILKDGILRGFEPTLRDFVLSLGLDGESIARRVDDRTMIGIRNEAAHAEELNKDAALQVRRWAISVLSLM